MIIIIVRLNYEQGTHKMGLSLRNKVPLIMTSWKGEVFEQNVTKFKRIKKKLAMQMTLGNLSSTGYTLPFKGYLSL